MKKLKVIRGLFYLIMPFLLHNPVSAQMRIPIHVFGNGGIEMSNASFYSVGTVGQPLMGVLHNATKTVESGFWFQGIDYITDIEQTLPAESPTEFKLEQNYPNPFNPETAINYQVPHACHVIIRIFNTMGQEVKTLVNEEKQAGYYTVRWDGTDHNGLRTVTGVYLYQIKAGHFSQTRKMLFVR